MRSSGPPVGVLALVARDAGVVTVVMLTAIGLGVGVTGADYLLSRPAGRPGTTRLSH